jgi:RNA-directed DNA polymerase
MTATPTNPKVRYEPLNLLSLNDLAWRLGEERPLLNRLANNIALHYKPFDQAKKAKPHQHVVSSKKRQIDNPSDELKRVQRKIVRKLLGQEPPDFLFGAVKGKTIHDNAAAHHGAKYVVKMDIKSYYPSVTNDHVYRIWRYDLGCSHGVAKLLTRLTTYERHLPQGAPTSSVLANIYLSSVYGPILDQCAKLDVKTGAFVDDIVFSGGPAAKSMMQPTRKLLGRDGFSFSARKREVLGPRDSKLVTGIRDGSDGPRAPYKKLGDLRAGFHKLAIGVVPELEKTDYIKRLAARVSHVNKICPKDAARYIAMLEELRASAL